MLPLENHDRPNAFTTVHQVKPLIDVVKAHGVGNHVIDIDFGGSGEILRKTVRAMNITADDPAKSNRHGGDMESLAHLISRNAQDRRSL